MQQVGGHRRGYSVKKLGNRFTQDDRPKKSPENGVMIRVGVPSGSAVGAGLGPAGSFAKTFATSWQHLRVLRLGLAGSFAKTRKDEPLIETRLRLGLAGSFAKTQAPAIRCISRLRLGLAGSFAKTGLGIRMKDIRVAVGPRRFLC